MPSLPLRLSLLLVALGLGGCDEAPRFTKPEPGEARSGGATTVRKSDHNAFSMPSANLSPTRRLEKVTRCKSETNIPVRHECRICTQHTSQTRSNNRKP